MRLGEFNDLDEQAARAQVGACLGVRRWVDELVAARPYPDVATLVVQAKASAENLTDDELASALARHPRIGESPELSDAGEEEAGFSRAEQGGVRDDVDHGDHGDHVDHGELAERLSKGNAAYEERFGRTFIVRAAGRSGVEILSELERRLHNDPVTERRETVCALRDIAVLRLGQVVEP